MPNFIIFYILRFLFSHSTFYTPDSTLYFAIYTFHWAFQSPHFRLLYTPHSTLQTLHATLWHPTVYKGRNYTDLYIYILIGFLFLYIFVAYCRVTWVDLWRYPFQGIIWPVKVLTARMGQVDLDLICYSNEKHIVTSTSYIILAPLLHDFLHYLSTFAPWFLYDFSCQINKYQQGLQLKLRIAQRCCGLMP